MLLNGPVNVQWAHDHLAIITLNHMCYGTWSGPNLDEPIWTWTQKWGYYMKNENMLITVILNKFTFLFF